MRLLKIFVIGMAMLIFLGAGVLAWGLAHHWHGLIASPAAAVPSVAAPAVPSQPEPALAAVDVTAPDGMHFEQMVSTADRLILRFSGPQGERILVIDPKTGHVTNTISVAPAGK